MITEKSSQIYKTKQERPLLSIVIPTMDAEESLAALFETLIKLDLSKCEILLINQGEKKLAEALPEYKSLTVSELLPAKRLSAPSARNFGAKQSVGKFLIFLDDDCRLESSKENFDNFLYRLENNASSNVLVLPRGRILKDEYIIDWPEQRPQKLGYFSAPRYVVEWNIVLNRELFFQVGGFIEIGPGTDTAAQCGEILVLIYRLLSHKVNIRLFEDVRISHPDLHLPQKKSHKVNQYYYGHGFSTGYAIRQIPFLLRILIFAGFNAKSLFMLIFPNMQRFMAATDMEYNNAYIRKNIYYIFAGFIKGYSDNLPHKELP